MIKLSKTVELKNFRYSEFASDETNCFEASVWIDGKRAGTGHNDGQGGPDTHNPPSLRDELDKLAKELPPIDMSQYGIEPAEQDAETLIGELVDAEIERRQIARMTRTKTYFRNPKVAYKDGEWAFMKGKADAARIKALQERFGPEVMILGQNCHSLR